MLSISAVAARDAPTESSLDARAGIVSERRAPGGESRADDAFAADDDARDARDVVAKLASRRCASLTTPKNTCSSATAAYCSTAAAVAYVHTACSDTKVVERSPVKASVATNAKSTDAVATIENATTSPVVARSTVA